MRVRSATQTLRALALLTMLGTCGCEGPTTPTPPPTSCEYSVSTTLVAIAASGGIVTVTVTATADCAWTAVVDRAWMTVTGGATGAGAGTVTLSIASSADTSVRTGTLTVAGHAVSVRQDAVVPCSWTLVPEGVSVSPEDHAGPFEVRTAEGCAWTAVANAVWLEIRSGAQGAGTGIVSYVIDRNPSATGRTGTISAGGRLFMVTQAGDAGACEYSVGPLEFTPCMVSPTMSAIVTTTEACTWTATPDQSWITVTEGQTGTGSGTVRFQVDENWAAPRAGHVMVRWPTVTAGQNLRVLQGGCYYAVSTSTIGMSSAAGTGRFDVYQQSDPINCGGPLQNACQWTATTNAGWITISTSMPQTGDNPVSFTVSANPDTSPRTGTITVRDKTVVVTQAGR